MADASVSIGGDAAGAIAACAAAQGAIDALHGKTVVVDIKTRGGGASGMGEATRDMQDFGRAADRSGRSTRGMGDDLDRAGRSARGMGGHVGRMANEAERARNHLAAVDNSMRAIESGGVSRTSSGMRDLADHADRARSSIGAIGSSSSGMRAIESGTSGVGREMKALESSAGRAGVAVRSVMPSGSGGLSGGGIKSDIIDMQKLSDGTYGVAEAMKAIGSHGSSSGSKAFSWAGTSPEDIGYTGNRPQDRSGRSHDAAAGMGGTPFRKAASDVDEADRAMKKASGTLDSLSGSAIPATRALMGIGLTAGVSALGMGALSAAVAGVGLAGVAEDFAHNTQLMHGGEQAIRGFNKAFTAMRAETAAAGMPEMAGLKSSFAGVGKELAGIGASNMGPVLKDVSSLGNQATSAMKKLEPSIGPAIQGLTALTGAVIGAFGDSGPAVTSFANTVTKNAAGLQALTSGVIDTAGVVGNATVDSLGGVGQFDSGVGSTSGKPPGASIDAQKGGRPSLGGALQDVLMSAAGGPLVPLAGALGASGLLHAIAPSAFNAPGGASGPGSPAVRPGGFDPSKPFSGMLPDGSGSFTSGTGDVSAPKPARSSSGPTSDGSRFNGMSAAQILTQQRADVGLPPVGQPHWSGVGPRGPGQSVGAMPASIGGGLGVGGIAPLNNMMQAAGAQVAGGGAQTGQSVAQHIQKAVNVAAPAAQAGGASIGAAMNTGMAQGSTSTQSVVDTLIIKHSKHIVDLASAALGVHSPSTEFDYLGRMTMLGFGQGQEREAAATFGSMTDSVSGMLSGQQDMASKYSPDYQGTNGPSVSVSKPKQAMDYASSLANANIEKHNKRATDLAAGREELQRQAIGGMTHDERRDQLLQNRAGNHERALANLGVSGHPKQSGDVNPFAADQANAANRRAGLNAVINPFHALGLKAAGAEHGQALAQGVTVGLGKGTPGAQAGVAQFGRAVQTQHKKTHGIASPSTVFASDGMNMAAGVGVGFTAGASSATSVMTSAAGTMSDLVGGQLSDKGLMVGYAYAQNIVTGVSQEIKKADYQALGLPKLNQAAELALAATGLLSAGSGAESYKTPGNAPGLVVLPAASSGGGMATVNVEAHFHLDGQITTISKQAMVDVLSDAAHTISLQQGS